MSNDNPTVEACGIYTEEVKAVLTELLEKLTDREAEVLRLRFGLTDGKTRTRKEVAQTLDISPERVRQIEHTAIHRPVHLKRSKKIADYYN